LKVITRIPGVHRALGYAVGMGARPEHVRPEHVRRRLVAPEPSRLLSLVYGGIGILAAAAELTGKAWKASNPGTRAAR
jgi:hypothetical protein